MGGERLQPRAEAGEECRARIAGTVRGVTHVSKAAEIFLLSSVPDSSAISFCSVESKYIIHCALTSG